MSRRKEEDNNLVMMSSVSSSSCTPNYDKSKRMPQHHEINHQGSYDGGLVSNGNNNSSIRSVVSSTPNNNSNSHGNGNRDDYYVIVYRGVVSLMSEESTDSSKSGTYVSYGEVVSSSSQPSSWKESVAQSQDNNNHCDESSSPVSASSFTSPSLKASKKTNSNNRPPKPPSFSTANHYRGDNIDDGKKDKHNKTEAKEEETAIHVKNILTGGYATPIHTSIQQSLSREEDMLSQSNNNETPKRSNITFYEGSASENIYKNNTNNNNTIHNENKNNTNNNNNSINNTNHGYLFLHRKGVQIAKRTSAPIYCENGNFSYRIKSNTPIPILVGPCEDAPQTRSMALPGTIHQVSVRIKPASSHGKDGVTFLRLSHKRGWIPDRKIIKKKKKREDDQFHIILTVEEILLPMVKNKKPHHNHQQQHHHQQQQHPSLCSNSSISSSTTTHTRRKRIRRRRAGNNNNNNSSSSNNINNIPNPLNSSSSVISLGHTSSKTDSISSISIKHPLSPTNRSVISEDSCTTNTRYHLDLDTSSQHQHASSGLINSSKILYYEPKTPSLFLMRVHAPSGLKILDAPHFQVSRLIHGQNTHHQQQQQQLKKKRGSSLITQPSNNTTNSIYHITNSRSRILPHGTIFEASKRVETAGVYTPGSGLIKLSDNSGWAIVPHYDDLLIQFNNNNSQNKSLSLPDNISLRAVEEIGNSIPSTKETIWLRILPRTGVYVINFPHNDAQLGGSGGSGGGSTTRSLSSQASGDSSSSPSEPTIPEEDNIIKKNHDDYNMMEASSTVSASTTSFLGSVFRHTTTTTSNNNKGGGINKATSTSPKQQKIQPSNSSSSNNNNNNNITMSENLILPCGMCVEVYPSEDINLSPKNQQSSQSFVRLVGGKGWIPRRIEGELFSFRVDPPDVRNGSFWFRVISKRGIKVRVGPSRRCQSIQNTKGESFRFECGEFLRASQILTIYGTPDTSAPSTQSIHNHNTNNNNGLFSECFAKLYRNHAAAAQKNKSCDMTNKTTTSSATSASAARSNSSLIDSTPGEWVQIHNNGKFYLEECPMAPSIERHFDGWRYHVVMESASPPQPHTVVIRRGPSFASEKTKKVLRQGDSVLVNERVTAYGEKVTWLRLKDGKGWIHDIDPTTITTEGEGGRGKPFMIPHSIYQRRNSKNNSFLKNMLVNGQQQQHNNNDNEGASSVAASTITYNSVIARLFQTEHSVNR